MFDSEEVKKRKKEEAYWKGVDKARSTGVMEGLLDAMADLVIPDCMGTDEYQAYESVKAIQEHSILTSRYLWSGFPITPVLAVLSAIRLKTDRDGTLHRTGSLLLYVIRRDYENIGHSVPKAS